MCKGSASVALESPVHTALLIPAILLSPARSDRVLNECVCIDIRAPVCASNDHTYDNICLMNCANPQGGVSVRHKGQCKGLYELRDVAKSPYRLPKKTSSLGFLHYKF
ncbi:hypothetical protein EVAR_10041_1 [Eumeta japonica]|uniref:Kazal-like domain-containing protein n=1 Tax=Eumeta variegata TaxID=151549 RepID=A0A4C1TR67_EUMVA|nr:hypothetical protein EVAR_10041_1 [Eumeta japonica]